MQISKKVAVLLSGGLDSSVCVFLLKKQGYDVVAVTGQMFKTSASDIIINNAKAVSDALGIKHYICDVSKYFQQEVIDYFENTYRDGQTPNPCIVCNKKIKWGKLYDFAINELGVDYVATGHYANIVEKNGVYSLYPAKDEKKDQLYYLFELNQTQLSKTIFPLAGMTKEDIRKIAVENNLPSKSSKESQDICFIQKPMTTKKFLVDKFGEEKGLFVMRSSGEKMGTHNGCRQYTVGQRKGIGIAYNEPLYVLGLDVQKNIVYVGVKNELYEEKLFVEKLNFQSGFELQNFDADVKIRYNMPKVGAKIEKVNNGWAVMFKEPVSSITKGQAIVVYDKNDGHLVAGGWI